MRWRWVASQPWGRTLVAHAGRLQEGRQNLSEGWWQSWHGLWPPRCMGKATIPPWRTPALRGSCRLSTYAPPQPDDLPACMPPASLAPPTGCPSPFPTLHPNPRILFLLWSWSLPSPTAIPARCPRLSQASDSMHLGL